MSVHAVFVTDKTGKPLISRNFRRKIPLSIPKDFQRFLAEGEAFDRRPVFVKNDISFVYIEHSDLFINVDQKESNDIMYLKIDHRNANVVLILSFLNKIVEVFENYFGQLEQRSVRDNFVLIYELFDEMCDFGYPQCTDPKMFKDYICVQEIHKLERPNNIIDLAGIIGMASPWKDERIVYKNNEAFLDVVEKLNLLVLINFALLFLCIFLFLFFFHNMEREHMPCVYVGTIDKVAPNGNVLHSEISGTLKMRIFLSGKPEMRLGLNDKIVMKQCSFENLTTHKHT
ncbi:hypothetical protein RFI_11917 [Reticulomyxa filosa]|uniref:MHD domain-containing protein n=1 Tax=Reticulomyxa filosa TaxID=46433 RepID=X6NHJ1_RETFI|nr:hypothetical protein RFI_11917 [Reticulomyxa filosa]|eukprot:ETO25219.1 hypothetical protein RFI_11917 [Reticulomyxa filosa]